MARIFLSFDGGTEIVNEKTIVVDQNRWCRQCEKLISSGATAVKLTDWMDDVYILCDRCAKQYVRNLDEVSL